MIKIPEKQLFIINKLAQNGFDAYIVGGCVRDSLLGREPNDFDVTTNALPDDVISIFEKTVPTGIKHGTVTVIIEGEAVEVTTFRTESGYSDSRHPDSTEFVSDVKFDLSRRDFTVNAMAYNETDGLLDLFGGTDDLKSRILRAVGEPEKRFSEDALRILRLFRFASQLDFSVEEKTLAAALSLGYTLEKISSERIFAELYKAVLGESFEAIAPLIQNGSLKFLKITKLPPFDVIEKCSDKPELKFFAFLYFASEDIKETLSLLKTSNQLKNYCLSSERLMNIGKPKSRSEIKEMLHISSTEIFSDFLDILDAIGEDIQNIKSEFDEILEKKEPYKVSQLKIGGNELLALGVCGAQIGDILETLRKYVVENPLKNNKNDLTEYVKGAILGLERL